MIMILKTLKTNKMEEKIKILFLALLLAVGLMMEGFFAGWSLRGNHDRKDEANHVTDTTWFTVTNTVTLVENKIDTLIRYVNRPYPVAVVDTFWQNDTMYVMLPYEHRHWSQPDTLDIWYSGVDPSIDSAKVYMTHTTEIIRQPYETVRMPRLTLDAGVGAMYHAERINPYLVGELRYNAPKVTFAAFGGINHEGDWAAGVNVTYRLNIIK